MAPGRNGVKSDAQNAWSAVNSGVRDAQNGVKSGAGSQPQSGCGSRRTRRHYARRPRPHRDGAYGGPKRGRRWSNISRLTSGRSIPEFRLGTTW
jgi:hypothetical protein